MLGERFLSGIKSLSFFAERYCIVLGCMQDFL